MSDSRTDLLLFEHLLTRAAPLSAGGCVRRDELRGLLAAAVVRRRRQRHTTRAVLGAVVLVLAAALILRGSPDHAPGREIPPSLAHADFAIVRDDAERVAAWRVSPALAEGIVRGGDVPLAHVAFAAAAPDPQVVATWSVPTRAVPAAMLADDAQILRLLAAADRSTGLVRGPHGVFFTEDVFDPRDADGP